MDFESLIEEKVESNPAQTTENATQLSHKVKSLEHELEKVSQAMRELQGHFISERISQSQPSPSDPSSSSVKDGIVKKRDDDTHYFDSYSYNGKKYIFNQAKKKCLLK